MTAGEREQRLDRIASFLDPAADLVSPSFVDPFEHRQRQLLLVLELVVEGAARVASRRVHPFRRAIETGQLETALELFSPDVVFNSPVVFQPYHGREALGVILRAVTRVFEDFRYEREIGAEGAADHALMFRARVGDRELHGCDFIHTGPDGLIDEMTVMVRPRSAALALAEAMQAELLAAERELGGTPDEAA